MKRMMHPMHGFHHAYGGKEEAVMRANGWRDDDSHLVVAPVAKPVADSAAPEPVRRTRGPNKKK